MKGFEFDFEFGKTPPKYSYSFGYYDFFTMLEMVQVEAGLDIMENKIVTVPQVQSNQSEISTGNMSVQLAAVNKNKLEITNSVVLFLTKGKVIEIELTQYGKHLLSKGEFKISLLFFFRR